MLRVAATRHFERRLPRPLSPTQHCATAMPVATIAVQLTARKHCLQQRRRAVYSADAKYLFIAALFSHTFICENCPLNLSSSLTYARPDYARLLRCGPALNSGEECLLPCWHYMPTSLADDMTCMPAAISTCCLPYTSCCTAADRAWLGGCRLLFFCGWRWRAEGDTGRTVKEAYSLLSLRLYSPSQCLLPVLVCRNKRFT